MARDLQAIVDSLGHRLGRQVSLGDPHMRSLAFNAHIGAVDEVRVAAILHRTPARVVSWLNAQGIRTAIGPTRVPANAEFRMEARVCAPIRFQSALLGYVWVTDKDQRLSDEELRVVQAAADSAAEALHMDKLRDEVVRGRERELLRDLLSDQPDVRRHAADELVEEDLIVSTQAAVAVVVSLSSDRGGITSAARLSIRLALDEVRHSLSPRHALYLVRPDHGLLALATEDPILRIGGLEALAKRLSQTVRERLGDSPQRILVGVGDPYTELPNLITSYARARQAVRVAEMVPRFSPVVLWEALGIYRTLLQFPMDRLETNVLHPGLLALISEAPNGELVSTLEVFLDHAGSAKRTSLELHLHRATLYYRLRKIEEIARVDLESGDDRLALHLGIKLARLAGILPVASSNGARAADSLPPAPHNQARHSRRI